MDYLALMSAMLRDMETAPPEFRPTNFWASGLGQIIDDLNRHGFDNFREHQRAHFWYVPVYGLRGWQARQKRFAPLIRMADRLRPGADFASRFEHHASQVEQAFQDFRLFLAADTSGGIQLAGIGESTVGGGERFMFHDTRVSLSLLNYLRGLAFLKKHVPTHNVSSIMEIGGGYGTLGEILLKSRPDGFYLDVDIPPVAAVATYYLKAVFGQDAVFTYSDAGDGIIDLDEIRARYRAAVLCPWQLPRLKGDVDLFANFISFQEMEPEIVASYAKIVQDHTSQYVLFRNMAKGKFTAEKGKIGVLTPTTTDDIIADFDQFSLVARDTAGSGGESRDGSYRSEVVCMERRATPSPS